jgi:copper chaperone
MLRFHVPNMTCGGCARSVTKAIQSVDSAAGIETDPAAREVRIQSSADQQALATALANAGFPAEYRPN